MDDAQQGAAALYRECCSLGLSDLHELSTDQVGGIISPDLHRERVTAEITAEFLNQQQRALVDWLASPQGEFSGSVSEGACDTLAAVGALLREGKAANQRTAAANAGLARSRARTLTCMRWADGLSDASDVLLRSWSWRVGQYVGKVAGGLSGAKSPGPDAFLTETGSQYRQWKRSQDLHVIALLCTYNEEDLVAACLDNLISQGISVFLIDNESTDRTVEIAREFEGRGLIGIETLHRPGHFSLTPQLRRKEELAQELDADWFMHVDADEIRLPPSGFASLPEAFAAIESQGFNAAEFMEYTFVATQEHPEHSPENFQETMQWYYPFQPFSPHPHRINAWRRHDGSVDLQSTGGHQVMFPGRKVYPAKFILKHYTYLSRCAAIEKFVKTEFDRFEEGMHGWRHALREEDVTLPSERELKRYTCDAELDGSAPRKRRFIAGVSHTRGGET